MAAQDRATRSRPVFVANGRTVSVGDVVMAAHGWDALQPIWTGVLRQVRAKQEATCGEDNAELVADAARLRAMSDRFRYDRALITAEETEHWLEARGLTLADFHAHLVRAYWAETLGASVTPDPLDYRVAPEALWDLLVAEMLVSGDLERLARQLSWRFAAADAERAQPCPPTHHQRPDPGPTRDGARIEGWASGRGADARWWEEFRRLEAAYRSESERLMTAERLERALASMRMDVTPIDLEVVGVDSLDAVREIAMCVREDGVSMAEVASEGEYPYQRLQVMFEDLPGATQQQVLRAAPGEMLDPLPHDDGFQVHRLLGRTEPTLENGAVRGRVEGRLLEQHFSRLAASSVRWLMAPCGQP